MSADSDCSDVDRENNEVVERTVRVNDDSHIRIRKTRSDKGVKKERTEAQKQATAKALSILKERREAKKKEDEERMSKATEAERQRILAQKYEKQKQHKAKLPPAPSYVTLADMENMKKEILSALPKEVYKAVEVERKVVKVEKPVVVEKPVEKPVSKAVEKPVEKKLTGHELLDKLFFTK
jgi:hypothetical protein